MFQQILADSANLDIFGGQVSEDFGLYTVCCDSPKPAEICREKSCQKMSRIVGKCRELPGNVANSLEMSGVVGKSESGRFCDDFPNLIVKKVR